MKATHEIEMDNLPVIFDIEYNRYKEDGEEIIIIESIKIGGEENEYVVGNAIHLDMIESCRYHYSNFIFNEVEKSFNRIHYGIDEDNL